MYWASQVAQLDKEPTYNAGDTGDVGSIPGSERFPGGRHGKPLQYSCLENPMDTGAWQSTIHRVTKSRTWLKRLSTCAHTHTHTHTSILIIIYSDFSPVLQLNLLQKKIVRYFHILFLSLPTKKICLLPLNFLGLMQSEYQKKSEQSSRQLSQLDCFKLEMTKSCQRKLRKKKKKTKKRRASKIRINPGWL